MNTVMYLYRFIVRVPFICDKDPVIGYTRWYTDISWSSRVDESGSLWLFLILVLQLFSFALA